MVGPHALEIILHQDSMGPGAADLDPPASIGTLQRIARVLGVDVADLLGRARPAATGEGQALVLPIRDALTPIDDVTGLIDDTDVPTVAMLARSVTYGWGAHWGGRYGLLAAMLPDLLAQSRSTARDCATADRARAVDLAAQVQQLTARTLLHLGAADAARLDAAAGGSSPGTWPTSRTRSCD